MREWDFWMWLAYGLLAIAATFLAADQGIKLEPELAEQLSWLNNKNWWTFSPLAFVITATIVFLLHDFGVIGSDPRTERRGWNAAPSDEIPAEPAIHTFNCYALAFSHGLGR